MKESKGETLDYLDSSLSSWKLSSRYIYLSRETSIKLICFQQRVHLKDLTYHQSTEKHARRPDGLSIGKTEGRKATDGCGSISLQESRPAPSLPAQPVTAHKSVDKAADLSGSSRPFISHSPHTPGAVFRLVVDVGG